MVEEGLHLVLWRLCNTGWAPPSGIIRVINDCEAQGIEWWLLPPTYRQLPKIPVFLHMNLDRPEVLRHAWKRISSQVSLTDRLDRTAEMLALETTCPLESLWLIRRESLYCFMGIWKLRRNESTLGTLPRDVIMIIAYLIYTPNRCPTCHILMEDSWRPICSCCGKATQLEAHANYAHGDITCASQGHKGSSTIICDACSIECYGCDAVYCLNCKSYVEESMGLNRCPVCKYADDDDAE